MAIICDEQAVMPLQQFCKECFKNLPDSDRRSAIKDEAEELVSHYHWEGSDRVSQNICDASTLDQALDHLAILRVAKILTPIDPKLGKPILESICTNHPTKKPHDIILPLVDGQRVVVEVKRFTQSTLGGDRLEHQVTEYVCCHGRFELNSELHQLTEDPNKSTNSWKLRFDAIEEKAKIQFDSDRLNLVWFVSRNALFRGSFPYSSIGHHYAKGWSLMDAEQPGKSYPPPVGLTGVAWSFDGPDGSHTFDPCCFLIRSQSALMQRFSELHLLVKEMPADG